VDTPVQDARSNVSLNRARNGGRGAGNTAGNDRVGEYCSVFFLKTLRNCALFLTDLLFYILIYFSRQVHRHIFFTAQAGL
jgi:hypothetical protein